MATTAEIQAERAAQSAYGTLPVVKDPSKAINIQFVDDGISAFGHVWVAGEVLSVEKDSPAYKVTLDFDGVSWLELDEDAQTARFGRRMFRTYAQKQTKKPAKQAAVKDADSPLDFEDPGDLEAASNPLLRKK